MAKQLFQDIVPPDKRSIRKIRPVTHSTEDKINRIESERIEKSDFFKSTPSDRPRPSREEIITPHKNYQQEQEPVYEPPRMTRPPRVVRERRRFPWVLLIILLVAVLAIGGTIFFMSKSAGAKITVTPRVQQISVDSAFTAQKTATSTATSSLEFQTVTISKDGKMEVPANGQEQVSVKASGTITIYNAYSSAAQKLIANTRFETPEGLIFRISNPVTVPGKSGDTPGSVEAIVTADKTGSDYNVGLKDFTIPGFKGDPRYDKIYARAKLPIQGGFDGMRAKVDPTQITTVQQKIKDELKSALVSQANSDIPAGYIMPGNGYFIEYEDLPQTQTDSGGAQVGERATFHGIIIKSSELAAKLSQKVNGTTDPSQTDILGVSNLLFSTKTSVQTNVWDQDILNFNLKGTTTLVSSVDTVDLQKDLVNKPRKNLNAILAGYPSVAKADVTMWPFWRTSFPSDPSEITIVVSKPTLSPE